MRRIVVIACLLFVSLTAAACGGSSAGGLSGKSAAEVLSIAEAAAKKGASFHFVDQTGTGKDAERLVGDVSNQNGQELLTNPYGSLEVRLVGATVYVTGNAKSLEVALGMTTAAATKYSDHWISLVAADAPYSAVARAMLPSAELQDYVASGDLVIGQVTTLHKHQVLPVSGTAPSTASGKGIATLYVSTTSPFVPVGGILTGIGTTSSDNEEAAFTAWGETIDYSAPSNSVAYSSIAK
jgi:hypothetical protein